MGAPRRSLDGAERNPGMPMTLARCPGFRVAHPGYRPSPRATIDPVRRVIAGPRLALMADIGIGRIKFADARIIGGTERPRAVMAAPAVMDPPLMADVGWRCRGFGRRRRLGRRRRRRIERLRRLDGRRPRRRGHDARGAEGTPGETGATGGCATVFGVDGLKVGAGSVIGGVTGCARTWPMAKAAIAAESETAAKSAAGRRLSFIACISASLRSVGRPNALPHNEEIRESCGPDNPSMRKDRTAVVAEARDCHRPRRRTIQ